MRIGQLSRRTGVTPERLRAWERRYGLLQPDRTGSGYRLYSEDDEARVREMLAALERGVAPAEAAAEVLGPARPSQEASTSQLDSLVGDLAEALAAYDGPRADAILDRLFAAFSLETALREALMPYLYDVGERWAGGELCVAQEHFASRLIEARLLSLATGWGDGRGPTAVLACASGEQHNMGLIAFGLALRARGWRIAYLGADTPGPEIAAVAAARKADAVVVSAVAVKPFADDSDALRQVSEGARLLIAGAGATPRVAERLGARVLDADPVTAAASL